MCVFAGYSGTGGGYSGYQQHPPGYTASHQYPPGYTANHQYPPGYEANPTASYTGGMTEEEQIEAAIRNSLNDRGKGGFTGGCNNTEF